MARYVFTVHDAAALYCLPRTNTVDDHGRCSIVYIVQSPREWKPQIDRHAHSFFMMCTTMYGCKHLNTSGILERTFVDSAGSWLSLLRLYWKPGRAGSSLVGMTFRFLESIVCLPNNSTKENRTVNNLYIYRLQNFRENNPTWQTKRKIWIKIFHRLHFFGGIKLPIDSPFLNVVG